MKIEDSLMTDSPSDPGCSVVALLVVKVAHGVVEAADDLLRGEAAHSPLQPRGPASHAAMRVTNVVFIILSQYLILSLNLRDCLGPSLAPGGARMLVRHLRVTFSK